MTLARLEPVASGLTLKAFQTMVARDAAPPATAATDPVRLGIYCNNVRAGLVRALESRFPVTVRIVGTAFFRQMGGDFVARHRPDNPVLLQYGSRFPAFVETYEAARSVPYLADVARLEHLRGEAYHAADAETVRPDVLAALGAWDLARTFASVHPAAGLLLSRFPVGTIWNNHQVEPVTRPADWRAETVLVTRPGASVAATILPPGHARFAAHCLAGASLMSAAEASLDADPGFDFGAALLGLVVQGAIQRFCQADPATQ